MVVPAVDLRLERSLALEKACRRSLARLFEMRLATRRKRTWIAGKRAGPIRASTARRSGKSP
jgi:hypothetical protein